MKISVLDYICYKFIILENQCSKAKVPLTLDNPPLCPESKLLVYLCMHGNRALVNGERKEFSKTSIR